MDWINKKAARRVGFNQSQPTLARRKLSGEKKAVTLHMKDGRVFTSEIPVEYESGVTEAMILQNEANLQIRLKSGQDYRWFCQMVNAYLEQMKKCENLPDRPHARQWFKSLGFGDRLESPAYVSSHEKPVASFLHDSNKTKQAIPEHWPDLTITISPDNQSIIISDIKGESAQTIKLTEAQHKAMLGMADPICYERLHSGALPKTFLNRVRELNKAIMKLYPHIDGKPIEEGKPKFKLVKNIAVRVKDEDEELARLIKEQGEDDTEVYGYGTGGQVEDPDVEGQAHAQLSRNEVFDARANVHEKFQRKLR
jgi:hypothetical protein